MTLTPSQEFDIARENLQEAILNITYLMEHDQNELLRLVNIMFKAGWVLERKD